MEIKKKYKVNRMETRKRKRETQGRGEGKTRKNVGQ